MRAHSTADTSIIVEIAYVVAATTERAPASAAVVLVPSLRAATSILRPTIYFVPTTLASAPATGPSLSG
jgi:hypothetical protein